MQRILVDVNVPGAGTHYEVRIPEKIYIYKLKPEILSRYTKQEIMFLILHLWDL